MLRYGPSEFKVEGLDHVIRNLRRYRGMKERDIARGLFAAGRFLLKESKRICPVQFGVLKSSGFVRNISTATRAEVVVGYTPEYAVYVHEDLVSQAPPARAAHGKFFNIKHAAKIALTAMVAKAQHRKVTAVDYYFPRGENQQAKFLEQPMRTNREEMFDIIASVARK